MVMKRSPRKIFFLAALLYLSLPVLNQQIHTGSPNIYNPWQNHHHSGSVKGQTKFAQVKSKAKRSDYGMNLVRQFRRNYERNSGSEEHSGYSRVTESSSDSSPRFNLRYFRRRIKDFSQKSGKKNGKNKKKCKKGKGKKKGKCKKGGKHKKHRGHHHHHHHHQRIHELSKEQIHSDQNSYFKDHNHQQKKKDHGKSGKGKDEKKNKKDHQEKGKAQNEGKVQKAKAKAVHDESHDLKLLAQILQIKPPGNKKDEADPEIIELEKRVKKLITS